MALPAVLSRFFRRRRRLVIVLAGLYGLWLLAGFFLLPPLLRGRVERLTSEFLHRPVSLRRVRFNPVVLTATLEGLQVPNRDGSEWISLRRLYLDYRLRRLLGRTVELAALELDDLTIRVELDPQGRANFQDLLEQPRTQGPPAGEPSGWDFVIGRFQLRDGRFLFVDRSQGTPFRTAIGPVNLRVDGIRTRPGSRSGYAFEAWSEAGEHIAWQGEFGLQPLASKGSLLVENLSLPKYRPYEQAQVATEIRSGTASLKAQYRFAWGRDSRVLEVTELGLTLRDVKLAERGAAEPAVELPRLEVRGGRMDLLSPSLELGVLSAERGVVRIQNSREGGLNLARLFAPARPKTKPPDEKPFRLLIRDLALKGFTLGWEDAAPARPVKVVATDLDLHWQELSLDPAASGKAALDLKQGGGSLHLEGTLAPFRTAGDLSLKAEGLDLGPWDPYLEPFLALRVASGRLGAEGRLRYAFEGVKSDGVSFLGGASVQDLEVRDAEQHEPFLRWSRLQLAGASFRSAPLSVAIQGVTWTDPEARLVVQPDGSTNVARALRLERAGKPLPVAASALPATPTTAPEIAINRLGISGGRLSFIDRSVQPSAALVLSELEGAYVGLSSRPEATSKVDFRGRAGGLAPITIVGHAMPLRNDLDTDVALTIRGADLTDFSPYTGRYLGYTVKQGKLDLDARLRIQRRNLTAENAVKLDQFYLGEKVQSPEATGLPVKLGLALLRDRKGVIAFDLPVAGSLDDPDVKYGRLVWKAILGLLGKIAASPFTLLGNLLGGDGRDLGSLAYAPGASALDAAASGRLQALAKALRERPELRLEAEGAADADRDGAALRRAALETLLRQTRARALNTGAEAPVPAPERERWLRAAHDAAFPAPREAGAVPPPPPAELEQRLLGSLKLDPADLDRLADARVKGVLAWLVDQAKVDPERVFQVRTGQAKGSLVLFALR